MIRITSLSGLVFVCLFAVFTSTTTFTQELPPTVRFIFPADEMYSGQSTENLLKRMAEIVSKKIGRPFVIEKANVGNAKSLSDLVLKKFKEKDAEFSYMKSPDYVINKKQVDSLAVPIATVTIDKKIQTKTCFFVRKTDNLTKVAELKGKVWGGNTTVNTRLILHDNGFDAPLDKFFKELRYYSDKDNAVWVRELLAGNIDVFTNSTSYIRLVINKENAGTKIVPVGCVDNEHNWIFFARKDIPADFGQKLASILFKAHKDPDFKEFGFAFVMLNGHFIPFDEKNLARTKQIVDLTKNGRWEDEEKAFLKKYAPVGAK